MSRLIDRMLLRMQQPISPIAPVAVPLFNGPAYTPSETVVQATPKDGVRNNLPESVNLDASSPTQQIGSLLPETKEKFVPGSHPFQQDDAAHASAVIQLPHELPEPTIVSVDQEARVIAAAPSVPVQAATVLPVPQSIIDQASLPSITMAAPPIGDRDPMVSPRTTRPADPQATQRPSPPQPVVLASPITTEVNISIGHIEVRAVQGAQPAARPAPAPHVTLADFLDHGRSNGVSR
ncbi:hypothetical protein [Granulicella sp. dw_53]|uniref:hypothetical protein n=1 Tax=Granulicella sp. dw_53 TaxID=2719792 RepID=UPI001BD54DD3|nr:hypothetical protein [Granulicella sp. dw_53]